jgi:hypothetical protein
MRNGSDNHFRWLRPAQFKATVEGWRGWFPLGLAALAQACLPSRARGEDHADYRYEFYGEENGRIEINTHSFFFEKRLSESLALKGEAVYDGISGATPTGTPPFAGQSQVPLNQLQDIRRAGNLAVEWRLGRHTLTPQIAYSDESDYTSFGISLNDAIEFNQKNTTLRLGLAHSFDDIHPKLFPESQDKDSTDLLVGFSQLLSPKTILTADFTFGHATGYLGDPYRVVRFDGWLPTVFNFPEVRPDERQRGVMLLTLTHFISPVNASVEASYRFHHDSFGITSHTAGLTWHQKLGSRVVVSPLFRFYEQSAADFYFTSVPGFFPGDGDPARPQYYSSDFRLSHMYTLTYGVMLTARVADWLSLDAGYQRYDMHGLDSQTAASAYPKANIVTIGFRVWF